MHLSHEHVFEAGLDRVTAMFADPEFAQSRAHVSLAPADPPATASAASEAAPPSAVITDGTVADGFSTSIRRTMPASSIPKEFRSFVGSDLKVTYTEVWGKQSGDMRQGTFAVEIMGAPGHARGTLTLQGAGERCALVLDGTVTVKIPLFGAMIESAVGDAISTALTSELAAADAWLAQH